MSVTWRAWPLVPGAWYCSQFSPEMCQSLGMGSEAGQKVLCLLDRYSGEHALDAD